MRRRVRLLVAPRKPIAWKRLLIAGGVIVGAGGIVYVTHLEEVPMTGRHRHGTAAWAEAVVHVHTLTAAQRIFPGFPPRVGPVPSLGRKHLVLISRETEIDLGRQSYRALLQEHQSALLPDLDPVRPGWHARRRLDDGAHHSLTHCAGAAAREPRVRAPPRQPSACNKCARLACA